MPNINPGYVTFQLAKALLATENDADAHAGNGRHITAWTSVLMGILSRSIEHGSRTPVKDVPAWATPEVVTGGLATGRLIAGGELQPFEREYLEHIPAASANGERLALNTHFLSDAGMEKLQSMLDDGCYAINVPEEGAMLVIAWLVRHGHAAQARLLIQELAPFFSQLRFYPAPTSEPRRQGPRVHIQSAGAVTESLRQVRPNKNILAQREALTVWVPFHDRVVALFAETFEDGCPCRHLAPDWRPRAIALLDEYSGLRQKHRLCGKQDKPKLHYARLRVLLLQFARDPASMTSSDLGMVRMIVNQNIAKHGITAPGARALRRASLAKDVAAPLHHDIALLVAKRIGQHPPAEGIDDPRHLLFDVQESEATTAVPSCTTIPRSIRRRSMRCQSDSIEGLVRAKLIPSGEVMAQVLPQFSSGLAALGIGDPTLRNLYAAIYRAFRRRRSLLLLNLEKQVRIEELPWVAATDKFRSVALRQQELAKQALEEAATLALTAFPQTPIPNKLLQEFDALARHSGSELPLTEELACDIFMGRFSPKFNVAFGIAAQQMGGTIYARYYDIDYGAYRVSPTSAPMSGRGPGHPSQTPNYDLAGICADRAGVPGNTWRPATNGMLIEQQQILTTHNLATLFSVLQLGEKLRAELPGMARRCFTWTCDRLQVKVHDWHSDAVRIKNAAYAWRQMLFYLSQLDEAEAAGFMNWARDHISVQPPVFREAFSPAWVGLTAVAHGKTIDQVAGARRFLGWSDRRHWLSSIQ